MSDDLEIRKQIAADAQVEGATAAPPLIRAFQFFLVPLLIVVAIVLVYLLVALLMGSPRSAEEWLKDLDHGSPNARNHAALQLVQALRRQAEPDRSLTPKVVDRYRAARPEEVETRALLLSCLALLKDPLATGLLLEVARDEKNMLLRTTAFDALGAVKDSAAIPALVKFLDDPDGVVRKYAAFNVAAVAGKPAPPEVTAGLKNMLSDPRVDVRWNAAFALGYFLEDASGTDTLKKMLDRKYLAETIGKDPEAERLIAHAMFSACNAAAKLRDPSFLPLLREVGLHERDAGVRHAAQKAEASIRN